MADFFGDRRGGRDENYDRRQDNNPDRREGGNNFDRRYAGDRSGGYFDRPSQDMRSTRATRATDDQLNRPLPPIEQAGQQQPQSVVYPQQQPQQYAPQPQAGIPHAAQSIQQQIFSIKNVVIFSPKSYADVQTLIDHLKRNEPAIVEFAGVGDESGQRILDFLSGAIYALGGSMKRVSGTIFLLTPSGVSISASGDIAQSIEERRNKR